MGVTRVLAVMLAIALAVAVVFAIFRAYDERSAPPIVIQDAATTNPIVVEVRGEVEKPGIYSLPTGARLQDAVNASGGFTSEADLSQVNLAERLQDGEIVFVGGVAQLQATSENTSADNSAPSGASGKVNINTATIAELDTLPGVGEVTAKRIIEFRETQGPYRSIDDLVHVQGISTKTISKLRDLVTVGP